MGSTVVSILAVWSAVAAGGVLYHNPISKGAAALLEPSDMQSNSSESAKRWTPPPPAPDNLWNECVCRGTRLLRGMKGSDFGAGQQYNPQRPSARSEFRNFPDDFAAWAYDWNGMGYWARNFEVMWGVGEVFRALGVSDKCLEEGGNIGCEYVTHGQPNLQDEEGPVPFGEQEYAEPGTNRRLPVTGAHFSLGINSQDGVLVVMEKQVARFAAQNLHVPANELPRLQRSSDIEWGFWKMYCDEYGQGRYNHLRYYLVTLITEPKSRAVIMRALNNMGRQLGPWPGEEFSMNTAEGKAILGTPLGFPLGYLLQEHKADLGGNMYISKVKIFHNSTPSQQPCYLFYIEQPDAAGAEEDGNKVLVTETEVRKSMRRHVLRSKL